MNNFKSAYYKRLLLLISIGLSYIGYLGAGIRNNDSVDNVVCALGMSRSENVLPLSRETYTDTICKLLPSLFCEILFTGSN